MFCSTYIFVVHILLYYLNMHLFTLKKNVYHRHFNRVQGLFQNVSLFEGKDSFI